MSELHQAIDRLVDRMQVSDTTSSAFKRPLFTIKETPFEEAYIVERDMPECWEPLKI